MPLLDYINPATVDYHIWVNVGMALKHEGYTASDWDNWSQNDSRYKKFECFKKWDTFNEEAGTIVTGATITQLAKENGWVSQSSSEICKQYNDDELVTEQIGLLFSWLEKQAGGDKRK